MEVLEQSGFLLSRNKGFTVYHFHVCSRESLYTEEAVKSIVNQHIRPLQEPQGTSGPPAIRASLWHAICLTKGMQDLDLITVHVLQHVWIQLHPFP